MQGATLEELRELSRRSRRAQGAGFLSIAIVLVLVPLALMLPPIAVYALFTAAGVAFVSYAYAVGQERGAFRRVFRRVKEERATRTIIPQDVSRPADPASPRT